MTKLLKPDKSNPVKLTPTEKDILLLVLQGNTNKAIAIDSNSSINTIEKHRESINKKFGVHYPMDLARAALYYDYIDFISFLQPLQQLNMYKPK